jgi:hypothetical protein
MDGNQLRRETEAGGDGTLRVQASSRELIAATRFSTQFWISSSQRREQALKPSL